MTTDGNEIRIGSFVERPWGRYKVLTHEKDYSVKLLFINPGEETSLQRHSKRHELVSLLDGSVIIHHKDHTFTKNRENRASSYRILAGEWHRFGAPVNQKGPTVLLEVAYGDLDPEDFQRTQDKYDRPRQQGTGFLENIMDNWDWRKD